MTKHHLDGKSLKDGTSHPVGKHHVQAHLHEGKIANIAVIGPNGESLPVKKVGSKTKHF